MIHPLDSSVEGCSFFDDYLSIWTFIDNGVKLCSERSLIDVLVDYVRKARENMSNITFMIGNGFDINLGLKTSYSDMYQEYIESPSKDSPVRLLKKVLKDDAPMYETWGDFEMAMAKHATQYGDEDSFVTALRDFRRHLSRHLQKENKIFTTFRHNSQGSASSYRQEFDKSLDSFYKGQIPNVVREIDKALSSGTRRYRFIVFNYTDTLDSIARISRKLPDITVSHIHGRLGEDILLGIDNLGQMGKTLFNCAEKTKRTFIKPTFNEEYDSERLNTTLEMIRSSDVICAFGVSFGESDKMWLDAVVNWLQEHPTNHLVYYVYSEKDYSDVFPDEKMEEEDELKRALLKRLCKEPSLVQKIFNQVHIPLGHKIFDFEKVERGLSNQKIEMKLKEI